jgi:hypothetical protein
MLLRFLSALHGAQLDSDGKRGGDPSALAAIPTQVTLCSSVRGLFSHWQLIPGFS